MLLRARWVIIAAFLAAACGKTPPPPSAPSGEATITGSERLGWEQRASDATELAGFRYAIFIDGTRSELANATCDTSAGTNGFPCSAPLPRLPAGAHVLEIATFITDGGTLLESARTPGLRVVVAGSLTGTSAAAAAAARPGGPAVATADGVELRVSMLRADVAEPTDLAFDATGRLFVAESAGRIRIVDSGGAATVSTIDGRPLAIALDARFADTHHVFVLSVANGRDGQSRFTLARYTETAARLGDRVVLLDSVAASANARGALRIGPDGKLYVAFDDAGVPDRADDLASPNGKIFRLERDGTTPPDQDGLTPVFAHGLHAPGALAWTVDRRLWSADAIGAAGPALLEVQATQPRVRGVVSRAFRLPPPTAASGLLFYDSDRIAPFRGNLFVASEGADLLRIVFDRTGAAVSTERLLRDDIGPLRAIAQAPDGAIVVATDAALWQLAPR